MSADVYQRIRENPRFQQLVHTRGRYAWTLAFVVLTLFYGYVLVIAFNPTLLGQPIAEGSKWTIGVTVELFLFILLWVLTALYVRRANSEFDAINQQVVQDALKENRR